MFFYVTAVGVVFVFTVFITRLCRKLRQRHYEIPARDVSKGHRWCMTDIFPQPTYCAISENHILHGAMCDYCGICVEDRYIRQADQKFRCKDLASKCEYQKHHWIHGNLPLSSQCVICGDDCGNLPQLCDYWCVWCNRAVHEKCCNQLPDACDLGKYRQYIIPPNCVRLKLVGIKGRRHFIVESVKEPGMVNWNPLIVIANRKSGNGDGEVMLQSFRRILNPAQVSTINLLEIICITLKN